MQSKKHKKSLGKILAYVVVNWIIELISTRVINYCY